MREMGVVVCGSCCLHYGGSSDVSEWNGLGHLEGNTSCKCTDLFVDVHQKGVGFPSSHLLNGGGVNVVEMHCHGSTSAQGVAAHIVL